MSAVLGVRDGYNTERMDASAAQACSLLSRRQWLMAMVALGCGCNRSGPSAIADLPRGVMALAASVDALLWTTGPEDGALYLAPLSGADPRPLIEGLNWARHIAIADQQLWLACRDQVLRVPLAGATSERLDASMALQVAPAGDGDPSAAFWTQEGGELLLARDGSAKRIASAGYRPSALAAHQGVAYWAAGQPAGLLRTQPDGSSDRLATAQVISEIAIFGDRLLYCTHNSIEALLLTGAEPTTLAANLRGPSALIIGHSAAYFINGPASVGANHALMRLELAAGPTAATVVAEIDAPQCLAFAQDQLFTASAASHKLWRIPLAPVGRY